MKAILLRFAVLGLTMSDFAHADEFAAALQADGPHPDLREAASVYDWLIGAWSVRVVDHLPDGATREGHGEWHFRWVLEGRAVQDVWIAPPRRERSPSTPKAGNRYGSTLRVYDADGGQWQINWFNPVTGARDRLIGRRQGADVVQDGRDDQGRPMRWVFTDIEPDAFRWYAERSPDGGASWRLEAEFFARRLSSPRSSTTR